MPDRSPRVLLVSHAYLPDSHAGVELYTARLASGLRAAGVESAVFTARSRPGPAQYAEIREEVAGIPVFGVSQLYPRRDLPLAVEDPAIDRRFAEAASAFGPDLIVIQSLQGLSLGILDAARRRGVPLIVTLHDAWWSCPAGGQRRRSDGALCAPLDPTQCPACFAAWRHQEGPLERLSQRLAGRLPAGLPPDLPHRVWARLPDALQRRVRTWNQRRFGPPPTEAISPAPTAQRTRRVNEALATAAGAVSPSRFQAESLQADGVQLPRWELVRSGVPHGTPAVGRGGPPWRLLFLGTWVPHKGLHVLVEALSRLPARLAALLEVTAVGPQPLAGYAREVVRVAADRVRHRSAASPGEVPGLLAEADALIVPSLWHENAPLVVLEARAAGLPVIASRLGGLPELVRDDVDGLLVDPADSSGFARALERVALDSGLLPRLREGVTAPPGVEPFAAASLAAWDRLAPGWRRAHLG